MKFLETGRQIDVRQNVLGIKRQQVAQRSDGSPRIPLIDQQFGMPHELTDVLHGGLSLEISAQPDRFQLLLQHLLEQAGGGPAVGAQDQPEDRQQTR